MTTPTPAGEVPSGAIRWSEGVVFVPNPEGLQALLHHPKVVAAITAKAEPVVVARVEN